MLHDLTSYVVGRLLLAAVLGGIIGLERELRHKPAGLRTNMLISLGAALFTIISWQMADINGGDHTRIAAQIITGIGFIGAGVVIRERGAVLGITSAATIFVIAAVGMACGAGMPVTAIFTTLLVLVALILLGTAEERFGLHSQLTTFRITAAEQAGMIERVHDIASQMGVELRRWQSHRSSDGYVVEFDADVTVPKERELLSKLGALHAHCEAHALR
jgi:putative Mg2+ transporter-C (MgtC) family protein